MLDEASLCGHRLFYVLETQWRNAAINWHQIQREFTELGIPLREKARCRVAQPLRQLRQVNTALHSRYTLSSAHGEAFPQFPRYLLNRKVLIYQTGTIMSLKVYMHCDGVS